MSPYASHKRRNLEKTEKDLQAGAWRISALLDPITEKKYNLYSVRSKAPLDFSPALVAHRCHAARLIASPHCPPVVSLTGDNDRIDILTPWSKPASVAALEETELASFFEVLLRTLSVLEKHSLFAVELFQEAVGRNDSGDWMLLPPAYALPARIEPRALPAGRRGDRAGETVAAALDPCGGGFRRDHHAALVAEFISRYWPTAAASTAARGTPEFKSRLARMAQSIARGEVSSIGEIYDALMGTPLEERYRPAPTHDARDGESLLGDAADRVLSRASQEGSVTVIDGSSHGGKSRLMSDAARALRERGEIEVFALDEWDLHGGTRTRFAASARSASSLRPALRAVWVIEDIDGAALAHSEFAQSMVESDSFPRGAVIFGVEPETASKETVEWLDEIQARRGDRFERITLAAGGERTLERLLETALERLAGQGEAPRARRKGDPLDALLAGLSAEARQLLEFVAVSRFSVPVEIVLAVFPEADHRVSFAAQQLASIGLIEQRYRPATPKGPCTLFFRVLSAGLKRLLLERMPQHRRCTLHRTLALAGEETDFFPAYFLLHHCLQAGDEALAARHLVKYLKTTKSEKREPFVVSLHAELSAKNVMENLSLADRVLVGYELGQDLLKAGQAAGAEALLLATAEILESDDTEQKLKSASVLSSSARLLADWWEKRGEYKRALELLDSVKFELQAALSIPDQARLLNDIGWLQYRLGHYDSSMESCRLSLNTINPGQHPLIVAQALNLMGVVHYNSSRYDEAISYYEQSAQLRERAGDENAAAASYNNLALAFQAKAEYEKALEYYTRSLKLKKRQNNQPGIAAGYLNLALLYVDMRNFKEAEARCRESLAVCEQLDEVHAQAVPGNYMTLGDIAVERGDLETARSHYQKSLDVARKMGAINEEMGAYRRLASTALARRQFDEARRDADKAMELVQRIGSKYESAQIEEILGDLELEQERQAEALEHYERAAGQYTSLSKYHLALKVLSKIGLIHAESANVFEARQYLDRARDYVRANIGHELPAEYVRLQRLLRGRVPLTPADAPESQRIMTAFHEMSALTDTARDGREFFGRLWDALKEIASPNDLAVGLKTDSDRFVTVDSSGVRAPLTEKGLDLLFRKALSAGALLNSRSADVAELLPDLEIPSDDAFLCVPLKAIGQDIGCLLLYIDRRRLPLSKRDANFFVWLGRQVAASLALMLQLNDGFLRDDASEAAREGGEGGQTGPRFEKLIGKSEPMRKIFRTLDKIRDTDSGILILGESGTGKSALARAIHYQSPRSGRPFREIHCAQIPYNLLESELFGHERGAFTGATHRKVGLCEMADGGTLFLDDINVVPTEIQAKLLRFIENKSFTRLGGTMDLSADARIIAASNEDLEALCREGRFREDLYFRLKVILIDLPPLRQRPEDTIAIALDYLKRRCTERKIPLKTLSPETIRLFQKAPWRGNVRELQNVLERIVVLSEDTIITPEALPEDFLKEAAGMSAQSQKQLDELVEEIVKLGGYSEAAPLLPMLEALIVKSMVDHVDGKGLAAQLLGISKPTLYARLRDYEKLR